MKTRFYKQAGYLFQNAELLEQAVTHSSYTKEHHMPRTQCNERLEFLGDAFFDAIIGETLYDRFPTKEEGDLTKYRAEIVCEQSLAETGRRIGIDGLLRLGRGEERSGGRNRSSIVADAMEAVIGAIYEDAGYEEVRRQVLRLFAQRIDDAVQGKYHSNYKSALQEKLQQNGPTSITYHTLREEGPDHAKIFYVEVRVEGTAMGRGTGRSKSEAEQNAAKQALDQGEQHVF